MADRTRRVKACWQCGSRTEVYRLTGGKGHRAWFCTNSCGPETLGKMFRIG